jgi:hypothetical protein
MISLNVKRTTRTGVGSFVSAAALALMIVGAGSGAAYAQAPAGLSPDRFSSFDALYTASVAVEERPSASTVAKARRVCDALDRGDRLLAATRTACLTSLKSLPAADAFAACATQRSCHRAARRMRIVLSQTLVDLRASNQIVAVELAPGACRTELTAAGSLLRSMEKLRNGLRLLERGLLIGKRALSRRGERQMLAASLELAQQPSALQARETFRRVCAPSGAPATPAAPPASTPSR